MRRLSKNNRYVSQVVWNIYDAANGQNRGPNSSEFDREVCVSVGKLCFKEQPNRPASKVAEDLRDLPDHFPKYYLARYATSTIRKWLKGLGPGKVGRPKTGDIAEPGSPDLKKISQALGGN